MNIDKNHALYSEFEEAYNNYKYDYNFLDYLKENNLENTIENYIDATIGIDNPDDDACNSQMQYLSGMYYGYQLARRELNKVDLID